VKRYFIIATLVAFVITALVATLAFADDPGSSPLDAMRIDGQPRYIQSQTWVWYYFDYNTDSDKVKSRIEAWVDNNLNASDNLEAAKNIELAIYTPEQIRDFFRDSSISPVGRGSKPPDGLEISGHDLYWSGNFNFNGRFFVAVKNSNNFAVQYKVWVKGGTVTLYPIPTPTSLYPYLDNPFATPIPSANITGTFVFQESSGGNIYTMSGDGASLKLVTNGIDPSWSPDGTQLAFTRWYEPAGMYVINADGTNEVRVWNGQRFQSPRWNRDGKRIVFTQPKGKLDDTQTCFGTRCFTVAPDTKWKIGVVELDKVIDGETTKTVLTEPQCSNHCFAPAWSPDGRYIVYADAAVGIMNTDTMTNSIWTMFNRTPKVESPSYSPDGMRVVFQTAQHDHWELAVLNLTDGSVVQITQPDPLNFRLVNNAAPTWSPDGTRILFLSDRHGKWEFYVVNVDGTNLRQVFKSVTDQLTIQYYFSNERVIDWRR
jgi:hypothetical protein